MNLSHQQIRDLLSAALASAEPNYYPWIRDVYEGQFTYEMNQRLYKRTYTILADGKASLGDAQQVLELRTFIPASFSSGGAYDDGDYRVYPNVLLFKAGDYPDKQMKVEPADLPVMLQNTSPFNINFEHSVDGALRAIEKAGLAKAAEFWIDPVDDSIVRAKVLVHKLIDDQLEIKGISVEIPYEGPKRFSGAGLTYTPRVADAALMAAFKELAHRADTPPAGERAGRNNKPMNFWEKLKAVFTEHGINPEATGDNGVIPATPAAPAAHAAFQQQLTDLQSQVAAFTTSRIAETAEGHFNRLVAEKRAVPGQKDEIVARFTKALKADNPANINFAAGEKIVEGDMTKLAIELYAQVTPHNLTQEQIEDPKVVAIFATGGTVPSKPVIDQSEILANRAKQASGRTS
jgi:hypothetical protein